MTVYIIGHKYFMACLIRVRLFLEGIRYFLLKGFIWHQKAQPVIKIDAT